MKFVRIEEFYARVIKINTLLHQVCYRSNIKYINNHLARDSCVIEF